MGVMNSRHFSDGYTPICNDCGIALCWDISPEEYEEKPGFWDEWRCKECYPKHKEEMCRQKQFQTSKKKISSLTLQ